MSTLEGYHEELFQEVIATASAHDAFAEDAFFELCAAHVVDAGDLPTADRCFYHHPSKGIRVDGYGGDPVENDDVLTLLVVDYSSSPALAGLNKTTLEQAFKRLTKFVKSAIDPKFRSELEESSPAFGLTDMIATRWNAGHVRQIRMVLMTNRMLNSKVDGVPAAEIEGVPVTHGIWDLARLERFVTSGRAREDIVIDLVEEFGGALPVLPAHLDEAAYESYLLVIPGRQLAAIYDRYHARLLEQNVRVFLQARGKVNKGLRNTLEGEPNMFFAFNNGVTATAEDVETRVEGGQTMLVGVRNLQIVNGGQTTASVHRAFRDKKDLSKVFVQMKLSVVQPERSEEIVPRISQYANLQNTVNAADFFANHPYHVRIQEFSRRIYTPAIDGTHQQTKWFYERARGQYQDERNKVAGQQRKRFDLEYPKRAGQNQLIAKTDLAKFLMVWDELPHVVSQGAQKNFAKFADRMGKLWDKDPDSINEQYYRDAIAKAIIFRATERIVTEQPWYEGGYRANIVSYAIAKLSHHLRSSGYVLDFDAVWKGQSVPEPLVEVIAEAAERANRVLADPPSNMRNISEWAKKELCWERVAALPVDWASRLDNESLLVSKRDEKSRSRDAKKDQHVLNGIEAQVLIVQSGQEVWWEIAKWAAEKRIRLNDVERGVLSTCAGRGRNYPPSERQSPIALIALAKLREEGCRVGLAELGR